MQIRTGGRRTKGELYLTKAECRKPREGTRISPGTKKFKSNIGKPEIRIQTNTNRWETGDTRSSGRTSDQQKQQTHQDKREGRE